MANAIDYLKIGDVFISVFDDFSFTFLKDRLASAFILATNKFLDTGFSK